MSTAATEAYPSGLVISRENLLFDFPEADLILRSRDSYEFRVLKLYIIHSSPILREKVLLSPNPQPEPSVSANPAVSSVEANAPCVVQLPMDGAVLFSLLTFIFPVPPVLPSTVEQTMELISVAQMYKLDVALTHIKIHIDRQEPSFIREETAFLVYSIAHKYGLRKEALQAARCTLSFSSLAIEDLAKEHKLDMMPGISFYELWNYHERARSNLTLDLEEFKKSNAIAILGDSKCSSLAISGLPHWLDGYISDIGTTFVPVFLDLNDFHMDLAAHIERHSSRGGCSSCSGIPQNKIRAFWEALMATAQDSITKVKVVYVPASPKETKTLLQAEPDFLLSFEETRSDGQAGSTLKVISPPKYSDMPNADVILQSSDLVHFRVHKSVLVTSSPFFGDMFSLPQPTNDAAPEELPIVRLSEDSEVLNSLISILYPVHPEIPPSSDNILALLSAAAKYDMEAVQTFIRAEVSRRGLLLPTGADSAEVYRVYAVAYSKRLIPEVVAAARFTLGYPLTFESLGDSLRLFEGRALRDLADFRLRSILNLCSNWKSFSDCLKGPSKVWVGCPKVKAKDDDRLPSWLRDCLQLELMVEDESELEEDRFAETIPTSSQLCDKYLKALQSHVEEKNCHFCMKVHALEGEKYCAKMKDILAQAWNVSALPLEERLGTP